VCACGVGTEDRWYEDISADNKSQNKKQKRNEITEGEDESESREGERVEEGNGGILPMGHYTTHKSDTLIRHASPCSRCMSSCCSCTVFSASRREGRKNSQRRCLNDV
jgi:hypothetical protein